MSRVVFLCCISGPFVLFLRKAGRFLHVRMLMQGTLSDRGSGWVNAPLACQSERGQGLGEPSPGPLAAHTNLPVNVRRGQRW